MPKFGFGFCNKPATTKYRNPLVGPVAVTLDQSAIRTLSVFTGCDGRAHGALAPCNQAGAPPANGRLLPALA
jgi:hypothetical protein